MSCKRFLLLAGLVLLALPGANAQAGPFVGVYVGGPYYYRPYWGGYYYYYPPPAVVVQPAPPPVVVQPAAPPTPTLETVPPPQSGASSPGGSDFSTPRPVIIETRGNEIEQSLRDLSNPDPKVRADAAIRLGRLKARRAAEPLERMLASDHSPEVRDASARALGLIGLHASVPALQRAAQIDDDRGVRSSAQFAIDVIRSR
jgi:HEAT repeats